MSPEDSKAKPRRGFFADLKPYARYMGLGVQFGVAVILCVAGGYFIDRKLATSPLFLLMGLALGTISGFWSLYKAVYPGQKKMSKGPDG